MGQLLDFNGRRFVQYRVRIINTCHQDLRGNERTTSLGGVFRGRLTLYLWLALLLSHSQSHTTRIGTYRQLISVHYSTPPSLHP